MFFDIIFVYLDCVEVQLIKEKRLIQFCTRVFMKLDLFTRE
jgi:hypothetical protein